MFSTYDTLHFVQFIYGLINKCRKLWKVYLELPAKAVDSRRRFAAIVNVKAMQ